MADGQTKSLGQRDAELFLVSVLILFLELVLIRWMGTEIRIFAYLGNAAGTQRISPPQRTSSK